MLRMKPYNFVWELRRGREDSLSPCIGGFIFLHRTQTSNPPNTEELEINWERTLDENNGEFSKWAPNYLPLFIIYTLKTKKILHHKSSLPLQIHSQTRREILLSSSSDGARKYSL